MERLWIFLVRITSWNEFSKSDSLWFIIHRELLILLEILHLLAATFCRFKAKAAIWRWLMRESAHSVISFKLLLILTWVEWLLLWWKCFFRYERLWIYTLLSYHITSCFEESLKFIMKDFYFRKIVLCEILSIDFAFFVSLLSLLRRVKEGTDFRFVAPFQL